MSQSLTAHRPAIITVAITGSVPKKADHPKLPVSVSEQVEAAHAAYEQGATLVHLHVRDPEENPSSDPALFQAVLEGIRRTCPAMIVQFSTGGRGRSPGERGSMLHLKPDMASLATGSVNFPNAIYENSPELILNLAKEMNRFDVKPEVEVFDAAMLYNARRMVDEGCLRAPLHVQFVLGLKNCLPARRKVLEFLVGELEDLLPGSTWTAAGIGRHQLEVHHWALERGGHVRTGLEDNLRFDRTRLAADNTELVQRAVQACKQNGRPVASPSEARALLGLPAT